MEEDKTLEQRSRDWWRGVHAAELDEPYNQDETEAWKEGYKQGGCIAQVAVQGLSDANRRESAT